jgi:S-formylglutathione hydrolase FrmB
VRARILLVTALVALAPPAVASASPHRSSASRQVAVAFRSVALRGTIHAQVVLPPDYDTSGERYPVVYFLHGLPAGPTAYRDVTWLQKALARLDRQAILVHPQGARGGDTDPEYLDWGPGRNWETAIAKELPAYVDAHFRTIPTRAGRAIVGLSAGGYGAAMIGFNNLDRFSVIESWSGYFHATDPTGNRALPAPPRANVHGLVARFAAFQRRHPTYLAFYVGSGDARFRAENEAIDRELTATHAVHRFELVPGGHERAVWSAHAVAWLRLGLVRLAPEQP